jgi:hypothetical protein
VTSAARGLLNDSSVADMRTTLEVTSLATQAASSVNITGGSITGITDLALADGGSASSTAAGARTNFGVNKRVISQLYCTPTLTLGAAPGTRLGGSTPVDTYAQVYNFDQTTNEYIDCSGWAPEWFVASTGAKLVGAAVSSATANNFIFQAGFRRIDAAEDVDTSHSYSVQSLAATATSGTAGVPTYFSISFTSAQIDSLAAGEMFNLRINRDAASGSDTVASDVGLFVQSLYLVEPS